MRWIKKDKTTRIKMGFLLFPKTIGNETRWLENATWLQEYIPVYPGVNEIPVYYWQDTEWI